MVDSADGKEKAGHTIIKSVIKSGSTDKIKVVSEKGETTISWIGGDTAGGADGKSAYDLWKAKDGNADKSEADFLASLKGDKGDKGENGTNGTDGKSAYDLWKAKDGNADKSEADFLASLKGQDGADGRQVIEGKGITATVNTDNTLTIAAKNQTKRWY